MAREANLNWILAWADAEEHPQLAQAFGVQAVPTVTAVAMGSPIRMFVGEKTRDWLEQWLAQVMEATRGRLKGLPAGTRMAGEGSGPEAPEPTDFFGNPVPTDDPRLEQAEELLEEGNFDGALELYDAMLQSEPANQGLKRAHANVSFFARAAKIDRSADPIAKADAAPNDVALALDAADEQRAMPLDAVSARLVERLARGEIGGKLVLRKVAEGDAGVGAQRARFPCRRQYRKPSQHFVGAPAQAVQHVRRLFLV